MIESFYSNFIIGSVKNRGVGRVDEWFVCKGGH